MVIRKKFAIQLISILRYNLNQRILTPTCIPIYNHLQNKTGITIIRTGVSKSTKLTRVEVDSGVVMVLPPAPQCQSVYDAQQPRSASSLVLSSGSPVESSSLNKTVFECCNLYMLCS